MHRRTKWRGDVLYERSQRTIHNRVSACQMQTGYADRDELISEADTIFSKALLDWKESGGASFSTFLFDRLRFGLFKFVRRESKTRNAKAEDHETSLLSPHVEWQPDKRCLLKDALLQLSREAIEAAIAIFDSPIEIFGELTGSPPKIRRGLLRDYLRRKGKTKKKAYDIMRELQKAYESSVQERRSERRATP